MVGVREHAGLQLPWFSVEDEGEGKGEAACPCRSTQRDWSPVCCLALFCAYQRAVADCNDALGHSQAGEETCKLYHV